MLDGVHFKRQPYESLKLGLFRKIPLMINTNLDEGNYFLMGKIVSNSLDPDEFTKRLVPFMNSTQFKGLIELYPNPTEGNHMPYSKINDKIVITGHQDFLLNITFNAQVARSPKLIHPTVCQ